MRFRASSTLRSLCYAVALGLAAVLGIHTALSPQEIPVAQSVSPDGDWIAKDVDLVPSFAAGSPIRELSLQRRLLGYALPEREVLIEWAEAEEDGPVTFNWNGLNVLSVTLPPSAKDSRPLASTLPVKVLFGYARQN